MFFFKNRLAEEYKCLLNQYKDTNDRLTKEMIDNINEDSEGRLMLCRTINEANALTKDQIVQRICDFLELDNPHK
jgi:hypothetical protein